MASKSHYEILEVPRTASAADIKSAYRKLVLLHHPDRSKDPKSSALFVQISHAYEVLSRPEDRRRYDVTLDAYARKQEQQRPAPAANPAPQKPAAPRPVATKPVQMSAEITNMTRLFSRGQFSDAERAARAIVMKEPTQPMPYAVLADIARARGDFSEALRMYSHALQMDPKNVAYLQRYEDLLERTKNSPVRNARSHRVEPDERRFLSLGAFGAIVLLCASYVAIAPERPVLQTIAPVSGWTLGIMGMLFMGGIAGGACLSVGNLLDRLDAMASGRIGPTVALGVVSVISFPLACMLYMLIGLAQRGFNYSTTRLMMGVFFATALIALAASLSQGFGTGIQVLLWGGNLTYVGALCGWMVADSLRR